MYIFCGKPATWQMLVLVISFLMLMMAEEIVARHGAARVGPDYCVGQPCMHASECTNTETSYTCKCDVGWKGKDCDEDINECNSRPCKNGGTCINSQGSYSCTCQDRWRGKTCNKAREYGMGDPHFHTLDGSYYDMVGSNAPCMYYLAVADDFVIHLETKFRGGRHAPGSSQRVVIEHHGTVVSLGYGGVSKIMKGHQWTPLQLPFENQFFHCYQESSRVQKCALDNGVTVSFTSDYWGRHDLSVPKSYYGKVKGLVGYFDGDSSNDFMMLNGQLSPKQSQYQWARNPAFENSWKIPGSRGTKKREFTEREEIERIIGHNPCRFVKNSVFDNCKAELRKELFYDTCKFDYSFCPKDNKAECFCGILDDLVTDCDITNHPVGEWRKKMEICNKKCPEGEVYNSCGNPCTYSCDNIKMDAEGYCIGSCLPMCTCPNGLTRDATGKCIPLSKCP